MDDLRRQFFNVGSVKVLVPSMSSEHGDHPLLNLLFCSSNFADEQYLSFLVYGSHHFTVAIMFI